MQRIKNQNDFRLLNCNQTRKKDLQDSQGKHSYHHSRFSQTIKGHWSKSIHPKEKQDPFRYASSQKVNFHVPFLKKLEKIRSHQNESKKIKKGEDVASGRVCFCTISRVVRSWPLWSASQTQVVFSHRDPPARDLEERKAGTAQGSDGVKRLTK